MSTALLLLLFPYRRLSTRLYVLDRLVLLVPIDPYSSSSSYPFSLSPLLRFLAVIETFQILSDDAKFRPRIRSARFFLSLRLEIVSLREGHFREEIFGGKVNEILRVPFRAIILSPPTHSSFMALCSPINESSLTSSSSLNVKDTRREAAG